MNTQSDSKNLAPILYLPHGGGPRPLMGDPGHADIVTFWRRMARQLPTPKAIVMISAHWEAGIASITAGAAPAMYYDYYNFPPETYEYQYPAPGHPALAEQIAGLLTAQNITAKLDTDRGYDHGMFVPLMLMYPEATIPCVQLSLLDNLDARRHIALGKALTALREQDILIIGSGMSFHNFTAMARHDADDQRQSRAFHEWLDASCSADGLTAIEREQRLITWDTAPSGRFCHPREEHLLPLHVCFGMAASTTPQAERVYAGEWNGLRLAGFLWQEKQERPA